MLDHSPLALDVSFFSGDQLRGADNDFAFPATSNYAWVPNSAGHQFGGGDFTIELFGVSFIAIDATSNVLLGKYNSTAGQKEWFIGIHPADFYMNVSFDGSTDTEVLTAAVAPAADGTRYDICVDRSGDTWRMYLNGDMMDSVTQAGSIFAYTNDLYFARWRAASSSFGGRSTIRAARITKGVARYASDDGYVVPTLPLPKR